MRARLAVLAAVVAAAILVAGLPGRSPAAGTARLGVTATAAPWPAEHRFLARRVAALRLPAESDSDFHIHAWLHVFVGARPVPVPAGIGIDPRGAFLAPLHTHDSSGIIHVESARPFPFTLGELFSVWGVRFSRATLGAYRRPRVWVDGRPIRDGPHYALHAHDSVVVGVGEPHSFPTTVPVRFPPGL